MQTKKALRILAVAFCIISILSTSVIAAANPADSKQKEQVFILFCSILPDGIYRTNLDDLNKLLREGWTIEKMTPTLGTFREGESTIISTIVTLIKEKR